MARKKLKLAFIENDNARKLAYKNRKKSLVKKVDEITTLCDIDACAIIYGPYDPQPEIWPSRSGVEKVLSKFKTASDQSRRMVDQESFLKQKISKGEKQLRKQYRDNREKETTMLMFQCLNAGNVVVQNDMSVAGLNDLYWMIDQSLKKIDRRLVSGDNEMNIHQNLCENEIITAQRQDQLQMEQPLLLPLPPLSTTANNDEIAMMSHGHLQTEPPLSLLPPPPPPPTALNNDEIAMMGDGHVGMAMNNNDIMFTDKMMNRGAKTLQYS